MRTPRRAKQVEHEIAELNALLPLLQQTNPWHDDNRLALNAQIKVLEEGLDADQIWDLYADGPDYIHGSAELARAWRDGEVNEPESKSWRDCCVQAVKNVRGEG